MRRLALMDYIVLLAVLAVVFAIAAPGIGEWLHGVIK